MKALYSFLFKFHLHLPWTIIKLIVKKNNKFFFFVIFLYSLIEYLSTQQILNLTKLSNRFIFFSFLITLKHFYMYGIVLLPTSHLYAMITGSQFKQTSFKKKKKKKSCWLSIYLVLRSCLVLILIQNATKQKQQKFIQWI